MSSLILSVVFDSIKYLNILFHLLNFIKWIFYFGTITQGIVFMFHLVTHFWHIEILLTFVYWSWILPGLLFVLQGFHWILQDFLCRRLHHLKRETVLLLPLQFWGLIFSLIDKIYWLGAQWKWILFLLSEGRLKTLSMSAVGFHVTTFLGEKAPSIPSILSMKRWWIFAKCLFCVSWDKCVAFALYFY
jgi:hypothetical protein